MPGDISDPTAVSRQVAARLRAEIYAGAYEQGAAMPTQRELVRQYGDAYSEATMYRALAQLAREGLITMGQGRKTTVNPRQAYRVEVAARWTGSGTVSEKATARVSSVLTRLRDADAAIADVGLTVDQGTLATVAAEVETADPAQAVIRGWLIAVQALGGGGWDLAGASVAARPA